MNQRIKDLLDSVHKLAGKTCKDCIYFRNKTYRTIRDGRYLKACSKCDTTSDEYDRFDVTVYIGDKACFVENNQIKMEGL